MFQVIAMEHCLLLDVTPYLLNQSLGQQEHIRVITTMAARHKIGWSL